MVSGRVHPRRRSGLALTEVIVCLGLSIALAGAGCAALGLAPAPAAAAPAVTTTADGGPGSLREAVALAAPGETITIPGGDYKLTLGELTIAKSLSLVGAGAAATTLEGGGASRVIDATDAAAEVTIADLTIRGGDVHASVAQGGGIFSQAGHLTLVRDTIAENLADATSPGANGGIAEGGGVSVHLEAKADLTVRDCTFVDNVADASGDTGKSGGIAEGGGLSVRFAGAVDISGSTFGGNQALTRGGGIAAGGGVFLRDNSQPGSLSTSTLSGNLVESGVSAGGAGAFISTGGPYPVAIDRVTVTGNSAVSGIADAEGGGLLLVGFSGGPIRMLASTIAANSADKGGDLRAGAELSIGDTVISAGSGEAGKENCEGAADITSLGFNLDSGDGCGFHSPGDQVDLDPRLGPPAENGGPTLTMLPAPTSPLVDQGAAFGLTSDQRGLPRPVEYPGVPNSTATGADGSDVGAAELQPPPSSPLSGPAQAGASSPIVHLTIRLGKLRKDRKRGTATLQVSFSGAATGTLSLGGKGLRPRTRALSGATTATLPVSPDRKGRRALRRGGRHKFGLTVTFIPAAEGAAVTATRQVTLIDKARRPARKKKPILSLP
jgi:hypothetical protein